jgi:DNA (cytosine-5)-methyltransferase 1
VIRAYYNEFDPKAAAWLRELIKAGLIADGDVDTRSITDVRADDLAGYCQCHFFAGIGGWSLALRLAGWPDDRPVGTGSCPCQPLSCAGQRKGHADERHLWPAFYGLIAERRFAAVFGEQVASKDGREWFAGVRADLEELGYACGGADLCAAGVGAPHRRQRLFWVADMFGAGLERFGGHERDGREPGRKRTQAAGYAAAGGATGGMADSADAGQRGEPDGAEGRRESGGDCGMGNAASGGCGERRDATQPGRGGYADSAGWARCDILPCRDGKARRVEAGTFPLAYGVPGRMGLLRGYGNAIVPQVAAEFVRAWMECQSRRGA